MFFDDFKMRLYGYRGGDGGGAGRGPMVKPKIGRKLDVPVTCLYEMILAKVKEEALGAEGRITKDGRPIRMIHWQLCHPANWPPEAKKLLRLSAENAGIKTTYTGTVRYNVIFRFTSCPSPSIKQVLFPAALVVL